MINNININNNINNNIIDIINKLYLYKLYYQ